MGKMKVNVKVPATAANLGAGLDCLGVAVDLWNEVTVEEAAEEEVCIRGEGEEDLPRDSRNLVVASFKLFISKLDGVDPELLTKFKFVCTNNIPLARGLGSSTAAIVGGLLAAAALGPHLQSRKSDILSGPTISTDETCNWPSISASADSTADSTVLKPVVSPTGCSRNALLAIRGNEATCSCLRDSSNKPLASSGFLCESRTSQSVGKEHRGSCVPQTGSDIPLPKAVEGHLPQLERTAAVDGKPGFLSGLLQIAGEIEGHADNAGAAIYGGLRLTLAWQLPGDVQSRVDVQQKDATLNMRALKPDDGLTTQMDVEKAALSQDVNGNYTPEVAGVVSAPNSTGTQGTFTEPTAPVQLVSSESTGAPSLLSGPWKANDSNSSRRAKHWIARDIPVPPNLKLVFFIPTDRLLTNTARRALPHAVPLEDAVHNVARSALFVHCLTASASASAAAAAACNTCSHSAAPKLQQRCLAAADGISRSTHTSAADTDNSAAEGAESGILSLLREAMDDKLHQPYRRGLNPHLEPLIASANQAGALGTALSGAGPSVVAFCVARRANEVASAMKRAAEQIKKTGRVLVTETSAVGAHIVDLVVAASREIK